MSAPEIPLLRESASFAARLLVAAGKFNQSTYHFHRRANWSYRYAVKFYAQEADLFIQAPLAYLNGQARQPPQLDDVYAQPLRAKQLIVVLLKVAAHTLFRFLGSWADSGAGAAGARIYRKAYVDDVELVFDPQERGVLRAVYPFPLNLRRQWRYLFFLRRQGHRFKLAGNPYQLIDLLRLLHLRDVRSLMRLESRAQVLHARQVAKLGVAVVQLSDEFDIGSLDFARTLARYPVRVVNSAHGVGKYFPVHAYQEFHVLTKRQMAYYRTARPCTYRMRELNNRLPVASTSTQQPQTGTRAVVNLVLLSQSFVGVSEVVTQNEGRVVQLLRAEFADSPRVQLLYKAHPNSHRSAAPAGFELIGNVESVNGHVGTVFLSFFSTCQIDPAFRGHKVLLRGGLIYPEIAFDQHEPILDTEALIPWINAHQQRLADEPAKAAPTAAGSAESARLEYP